MAHSLGMKSASDRPEITPEILLRAYAAGLFPMAESESDESLFWVDPEERGIFPLDGLTISRSLAKAIRADRFEVSADGDFDAVVEGCAHGDGARENTWINPQIRKLYRQLFEAGFVHTIECRRDGALVGGLYGVALGAAFFGESMFHKERDASKVALAHLVARLRYGRYLLLDTQFVTPHLASLGALAVPRDNYHALLDHALEYEGDFFAWTRDEKKSGAEVLALLQPSGD